MFPCVHTHPFAASQKYRIIHADQIGTPEARDQNMLSQT